MKILITGCAGFIGFHTTYAFLKRGDEVIGIDNVNDYYDISIKQARLKKLEGIGSFEFHRENLADRKVVEQIFRQSEPEKVVHLAAQAGVRYSILNPYAYVESNIQGFLNILEGCRHFAVKHLVFASTSSVYGANTAMPFRESQNVDHPLSFYAATKKSNELMAHTYAHLYGIPVTGLRFFTVYGPWGRPDMALFKFTRNILADKPIDVYNNGHHARDFTYIDDIVHGVVKITDKIAEPDPTWDSNNPNPSSAKAPYRLYNIGNNVPVPLMYFIECLEKSLGKTAEKNFLPLQAGDVPETFADIDALSNAIAFHPTTKIEDGIQAFVDWYLNYYKN